jgi:FeS assembly SUF system regulator
MIRLSRLTDYGILLMTLVARDSGQRPRAARDLADEANLPLPTVSKILKILLGHELLVSHRGVKGGYNLARTAQDISVAQVIEAMEGPIGLTECSSETGSCELSGFCPMRSNWAVISDALRDALEKVKLADLVVPLHLAKKSTGNMVFLRMPTGRMQ